MEVFVVLLPEKHLIDKIIKLRYDLKERGISGFDSRIDTLPHTTVSYFRNVDNDSTIDLIKSNLKSMTNLPKISADIVNYGNYADKITAFLNSKGVFNVVATVEVLLKDLNVIDNENYVKMYKTPVGDHLKLVRAVPEEKINEVIKFFKETFLNQIVFDRLALVDIALTESHIIWQKNLF